MSSLEQFGEAFFPPKQSKVSTAYGTVTAINADGSYQVKLNAIGTTRCARLCNAAVDDAVFVVIQENGKCAAVGKVGGESSSGGNTYSLGADSGNALKAKLTENGTDNAGSFTVPDGTTSAKGAVQLETSYTSDSETKAATPKSVKQAVAAAASYTDAQIIAAGAVTGVKGAAQENYQTGNVSLSASDVGAAPVSHTHAASSITTTDGNVQSDLDTIYQDIGDLDTALAGKANSTHYHSASAITSGTLGVARGGTGASTLGKGIVYHSSSGTGALSIATAANIVSEIGNTPVNRATADANGDAITATYSKVGHTHTIGNVTGLQDALDGKAASSHTHAISGITGLQDALDAKAPTNHAASGTTYGKGTDDLYGHVKLSDSTSSSTAASSGGTAATPAAVKAAYDRATTALGTAEDAYEGLDDKANKSEAIKDISRSGLTFTATRCDDTTFTFTQKDTTYSTMTKSQADTGTGTTGLLITPKVLADYVSEHQGGGQSYTTLYYSLAGSHDNISLSDSAANYDHMRIYFEKDSQTESCASIDVYKPNGRNVSTVLANVYTGGVQFLGAVWYINGTSITRVDNEAWANCASGITGGNTSSYTIQIYRVEAW